MKAEKLENKGFSRLEGKTVAVNGATGGLGQALCRHLSALGAELLLLDRNSVRSKELIRCLKEEYPGLKARHIRLDLEDIDTVREVIEELKTQPPDFLILNAGAYHVPIYKCSTGYNNVFQINFFAPYLMARELLPFIRERGGRVVAVGSIAHRYSHTDPFDVDFSGKTRHSLIYGNAKRYLIYSMLELSREGGVSVTHPGITLTNITAHYPKAVFALIKHPMKVIFMSPERASLSILAGIYEDCHPYEWIGPELFDIWGRPKKKPLCGVDREETAFIQSIRWEG